MIEPTPEQFAAIIREHDNGNLVVAVKKVREVTGASLLDAKNYVEAVRDGQIPEIPQSRLPKPKQNVFYVGVPGGDYQKVYANALEVGASGCLLLKDEEGRLVVLLAHGEWKTVTRDEE